MKIMSNAAKALLSAMAVALMGIPATAQEKADSTGKKENKIKFAYDVSAGITFDNREYDRTDLDKSQTLFGIRPEVALGITFKGGKSSHSLLGGAAPLYEFGGDWTFQPLLYYQGKVMLKKSRLQILAGAFSRNKSEAYYSPAFWSGSRKFRDATYEGFQFSWTGKNFYYELGLDWMGMIRAKSPSTREEFVVYSGGHHKFAANVIKLGYSAYMHHYACSMEVSNVVDDILVNPYLEAEFGYFAHIQRLTARLGYLQAYQLDRKTNDKPHIPAKGEFYLEARHWNAGITNHFLFGADMMPYYNALDPVGKQYGGSLYMGDPLTMRNADGRSFGIYDKLSVYYEPQIWKYMKLRLQIDCHFNDNGFAGWKQVISVVFFIKNV